MYKVESRELRMVSPWSISSDADVAEVLQQSVGYTGDRGEGSGTRSPAQLSVDNGQVPAPVDREPAAWTVVQGNVAFQPKPQLKCRLRVSSSSFMSTYTDRRLSIAEAHVIVLRGWWTMQTYAQASSVRTFRAAIEGFYGSSFFFYTWPENQK